MNSAISFRGKWIEVGELWFGEEPGAGHAGADLLQCLQAPQLPPGFTADERFETLVNDLRADPDALFAGIGKTTQYEIRRATERDQIACELWLAPDPTITAEFGEFFARFAAFKGLGDVRGPRLAAYRAAGRLALSRCQDPEGKSLGWHAYVVGGTDASRRARLLYSASARGEQKDAEFRNRVGRANRLLHWRDMQAFRDAGVAVYDLGGWYPGSDDKEKLNINLFKEQFGGRHETSWHGTRAVTARGHAYRLARALRGRLAALRR